MLMAYYLLCCCMLTTRIYPVAARLDGSTREDCRRILRRARGSRCWHDAEQKGFGGNQQGFNDRLP